MIFLASFLSKVLSVKGVSILFAFILLFTLVGFVIKKRKALNKPIVEPRIMRYLVLPTLFIYTFCVFVFNISYNAISVKITETILIIFGIAFLLQLMSHMLLSENNILSGKETIPKLDGDLIQFILILVSSTFVLSSVWGFDLGHLLTALGVGSFVIGLALQEPLGNLFNGIALLIAKPFENEDWVEVGGITGKVVEINWRSVKIINRFSELIVIPNNLLGKERIKNLSRPSKVHAELVEIGFSYGDDPIKVKEVLKNVAESSINVLNSPAPASVILSYEDFYINYGLKFYITDFEDQVLLKDEIMTNIYKASKDNKLTILFPIKEIHLKNTTNG